jgi:hypothetical protein
MASKQTIPFRNAKRAFLDEFERKYFGALSRQTDGCISEMARRAGMERVHLRAYLKRHQLGPYAEAVVVHPGVGGEVGAQLEAHEMHLHDEVLETTPPPPLDADMAPQSGQLAPHEPLRPEGGETRAA